MLKTNTYKILFFLILLITIIQPIFSKDGGMTVDILEYMEYSDKFPHLTRNVFPLGFPLLINFFHFFTKDNYISTRILAFLGVLSIGLISFYKKFYFKETVLLLCLKIIWIFQHSWSEVVFLPLLYFLTYSFFSFLMDFR